MRLRLFNSLLRVLVPGSLLLCSICFGSPAAEPWTEPELRAFARDLSDYVTAHHIKRDTNSAQFGMIYKWYRPGDGKWIVDKNRNMMSDGARFSHALCLYYRATGQWWPVSVLKKYSLPFYCKTLIHSDETFHASKGICPLWWDDGASIASEGETAVKGFAAAPKITSNELAADLAIMLLAAGQLVPDTDLALATGYLFHSDRKFYDLAETPVPLGVAAAVVGDIEQLRTTWFPKRRWQFYEGPSGTLFDALILGKKRIISTAFPDPLQDYAMAAAAQPWQPIRESFAKNFIYNSFSGLRMSDLWSDRGPAPHGVGWPIVPALSVNEKFGYYRTDKQNVVCSSRVGTMQLCSAALALQMFDAWPQAWEAWTKARKDGATRITEKYTGLQTAAGSVVEVAWTPTSMLFRTRAPRKLTIAPIDPQKGLPTTVVLAENGRALAVTPPNNTALEVATVPQADGRVEIEIPFTLGKSQKPWLNAVEESQCLLALDDDPARTMVFLSSPSTVRARLAMEVGDGLRYWQKVFKQNGYIPGRVAVGLVKPGPEAELSDTGAYAGLIGTIAEYILWLRGERDWELAVRPPSSGQ